MERVSEVLHERDVRAGGEAEPKSVAERKGEVPVTVGGTQLLTAITRAEIPELDHPGRDFNDLVKTRATAGVKERL